MNIGEELLTNCSYKPIAGISVGPSCVEGGAWGWTASALGETSSKNYFTSLTVKSSLCPAQTAFCGC